MTEIVGDSKETLAQEESACFHRGWHHLAVGFQRELSAGVSGDLGTHGIFYNTEDANQIPPRCFRPCLTST